MGEFSLTHLLLFAVVLLIFFGPSRLPGLGQSIGKAIRGFKDGLSDVEKEASAPSSTQSTTSSTEKLHAGSAQATSVRDAELASDPVHDRSSKS